MSTTPLGLVSFPYRSARLLLSVRAQAPRGYSHSPIAHRSRPLGCSVRYARTSPSVRHYFTRVPPRHPQWQLRPMPLCYHNLALSSSSPALVPRWGIIMITEIMNKCGQVLVAHRWRSSRAGPPGPPSPGVATPGARLGDPYPPPCLRCVLYFPFPTRARVSLSLQTRRGLARSSRSAMGEFRSFVRVPAPPFSMLLASLVTFTADVSLRSPPLCGFFPRWAIVQADKSHHAAKIGLLAWRTLLSSFVPPSSRQTPLRGRPSTAVDALTALARHRSSVLVAAWACCPLHPL